MSAKRYDRAYFDRWYRDPRTRMWPAEAVARKVRMVLGFAEHLLERPVASVLDVGCGEGTWQPILTRLRPGLRYVGVDSSTYAVARFGRRRHIRLGDFAGLHRLGLSGRFDLVVCCDVIHYLPTRDLTRGLGTLHRLARGPAYLEAYTGSDDVEGDDHEFQRRSTATYRRLFREAGFTSCGMHCYVSRAMARMLLDLERG